MVLSRYYEVMKEDLKDFYEIFNVDESATLPMFDYESQVIDA